MPFLLFVLPGLFRSFDLLLLFRSLFVVFGLFFVSVNMVRPAGRGAARGVGLSWMPTRSSVGFGFGSGLVFVRLRLLCVAVFLFLLPATMVVAMEVVVFLAFPALVHLLSTVLLWVVRFLRRLVLLWWVVLLSGRVGCRLPRWTGLLLSPVFRACMLLCRLFLLHLLR